MRDYREVYARGVRAERARAGLTQQQLAEVLGIPRSAVAEIERARRRLTLDEALVIAEVLDVSVSALVATGRSERDVPGF